MCVANNHFADSIQFLATGTTLEVYSNQQKKELVVHVADVSIIAGHLYKMGLDEILRRYILVFEHVSILAESHGGVARGHYVGKVTAQKIFHAGV